MEKRKAEDIELRRQAMDSFSITKPNIPPRRVWDLYSNRVLPFSALPLGCASGANYHPSDIPSNFWAVSHSWQDPDNRVDVLTSINNKDWPVPIPKGTTLDDVRIELLNLGAEYVFLDVLCLRQKGEEQEEFRRKEEWRLDVPTLGRIYRHRPSQTIITYFNGLGLPFQITTDLRDASRHWLNRVWTLQETTVNWVPGGLTMSTFADATQQTMQPYNFIYDLQDVLDAVVQATPDLVGALEAVRHRRYANPVDQVTGLAYLLRCETLPLYNPDQSPEEAWDSLLQVMGDILRTDLFLWWTEEGKGKYAWRPSWEELMTARNRFTPMPTMIYDSTELIQFSRQGHMNGLEAYYHKGYLIESCLIIWQNRRQPTIEVRPVLIGPNPPPFKIDNCNMPSSRVRSYAIVGVANLQCWIVGKITRKCIVGGESAYEIKKESVFMMTDEDERNRLNELALGIKDVTIVYC